MSWDDDNSLTVVPKVDDNPYDPGLAALLYAHGAVQEAEEIHRKLVASGGKVPKGGFPSRCTTTDERGVRCFLAYAHPGAHDFGSGPENSIVVPGASWYAPDSRAGQLKERMNQLADQQPPRTRIISDDAAMNFLNSKVEDIQKKILDIDHALEDNDRRKVELQQERAMLRRSENDLHTAIATLTGVRAKKLGEGNGGSR